MQQRQTTDHPIREHVVSTIEILLLRVNCIPHVRIRIRTSRDRVKDAFASVLRSGLSLRLAPYLAVSSLICLLSWSISSYIRPLHELLEREQRGMAAFQSYLARLVRVFAHSAGLAHSRPPRGLADHGIAPDGVGRRRTQRPPASRTSDIVVHG